MRNLVYVFLAVFGLVSCTTDMQVKPNWFKDGIVVDGHIDKALLSQASQTASSIFELAGAVYLNPVSQPKDGLQNVRTLDYSGRQINYHNYLQMFGVAVTEHLKIDYEVVNSLCRVRKGELYHWEAVLNFDVGPYLDARGFTKYFLGCQVGANTQFGVMFEVFSHSSGNPKFNTLKVSYFDESGLKTYFEKKGFYAYEASKSPLGRLAITQSSFEPTAERKENRNTISDPNNPDTWVTFWFQHHQTADQIAKADFSSFEFHLGNKTKVVKASDPFWGNYAYRAGVEFSESKQVVSIQPGRSFSGWFNFQVLNQPRLEESSVSTLSLKTGSGVYSDFKRISLFDFNKVKFDPKAYDL